VVRIRGTLRFPVLEQAGSSPLTRSPHNLSPAEEEKILRSKPSRRGHLNHALNVGQASCLPVAAQPPICLARKPSPDITDPCPAFRFMGKSGRRPGERFPLVPPVFHDPVSGLRPIPTVPPQLMSIPARSSDATTLQNRRPPHVPPQNLRRPDEIAQHPIRNLPVPGRNARVPGRNLRIPARNGVVPRRNASVPGRNLSPRPRNHRVPTRLEHLWRANQLLNIIETNRLQ